MRISDWSSDVCSSDLTGLIAAGELLRRGVRCRLIDRLPVPHQTSKSFTIHSRTMEMMEHIGIAHRYLDTGIKSNGFTFNFENTEAKPILDFSTLPGRFPFIMIRSEEHTSELQSLMRISYACFCL